MYFSCTKKIYACNFNHNIAITELVGVARPCFSHALLKEEVQAMVFFEFHPKKRLIWEIEMNAWRMVSMGGFLNVLKRLLEQKEDNQAKTKCFDEFDPITAPSSLGEEKSC